MEAVHAQRVCTEKDTRIVFNRLADIEAAAAKCNEGLETLRFVAIGGRLALLEMSIGGQASLLGQWSFERHGSSPLGRVGPNELHSWALKQLHGFRDAVAGGASLVDSQYELIRRASGKIALRRNSAWSSIVLTSDTDRAFWLQSFRCHSWSYTGECSRPVLQLKLPIAS